jgi:hypothetical protein
LGVEIETEEKERHANVSSIRKRVKIALWLNSLTEN